MTISHHPDAASLMAYAAGTFGEALSAVVAAHLDRCPQCRSEVARLCAVGGALVDAAPEAAMSDAALDRAMRLLDRDAPIAVKVTQQPSTVERLLGCPLSEAKWSRVAPGVQMIRLPVSANATGELRLMRIGAGRAMPDHGHGGAEMTLVLSGAYADTLGRFGPGDVADLDEEVEHKPTVEAGEDCICLVASEHQAKYKGRLMRILQPLLGV